MREIRMSGSEGGAPQDNGAFLPLSVEYVSPRATASWLRPRFKNRGHPPFSVATVL